MAEFVAVFQVSRHGPFLARNLVGKSAGEITARLLDSGVAVAQVSERRLLHPLAQGKISIKDIVYFMEQLENTLFLGMEPRIALKACAITISQKSKSGRNLQRVVAAMERMVAGGESIANVARQFPNLFSNVAVGLLEAGERSGSMNESLRSIRVLTARTESVRHQTSMMLLQPGITLLMATVTVGVMVTYIVPQFRSILDYLGGKLPWQTQLMIDPDAPPTTSYGQAYRPGANGRRVTAKLASRYRVPQRCQHLFVVDTPADELFLNLFTLEKLRRRTIDEALADLRDAPGQILSGWDRPDFRW